MELSALKFAADTTELERASKVIAGLVTDVSKLDKASRDAAQTEAILAKAAKSNADANLQNAKAQDVRLKSTIAADKADKANEQSVVKKTNAIEKETEATAKNVGVLQKQKDILEFQTQGYSKGQAGILAYGKAAGLATSDIAELGKVLETQRKLMGGDPFDKSLSGIKSLQNQYTELKESLRQYNTDSELSAKQTRELARDKERLIEKMKVEGASFQDIRKAVRAHNDEYVNLAGQYNKLASAEDAVVKSRKEAVTATDYLTQADQKMAAALSTTNAALDKAGTDSLVKYEQALRKSGVSQDVATAKLAKYKVELAQVQNQEQKRREQHLARAISPQITDIGVSLYSGQAPLTVLLQQSGQLLDLFTLSGVEADKFGETMKRSFYSMVPAIGTVAKGMAGLVSGLVVDAGKGITNFIGNITGINLAMESAKRALASGGEENFKYIASLQKLGNIASATSAILAGGLVLSLIAMAVGLKQIISENNELAKSLALNNGNLAITQSSAVEYVRLLGEMGVTTGKATEAISAMAKEGKFTRDEILLVGKAASDMAKYADVAIEDTVKSFAKLKDKPVEGLIELAQKTGMVSPEVIKLVIELEKQGKIAEATAISMKALGSVTETQVAQMKENYNGFTLFILELGAKIKQFFSDTFKVLFLATDPTQQLQDNLGKVQERIKEVRENLEGNSKVLNFLGIGTDTKLLDSLKEQERQILKNIDRQVSANQVKEQELATNVQNAKVLGVQRELEDKADKAIDKQKDKLLNMEDYRKKFVQDKLADYAKEKNIDIEALRGNEKILSVLKEQADVEFKKIHKKESNAAAKQGNKDLETEIDLRNKALGLLGSFNNELDAIERQRAKTGDEDQYQKSLNALIEKQPIYLERQKEINATHDLTNKLFGKADVLGKDYYKTLEQINKEEASGLRSPENAERARQAAFDQTELAKTRLKIEQDSAKLAEKYRDDIEKAQNASTLETANLDDRLALLGLTSEQQKNLRTEQERRNKLLAIDLKLQTQIREVWDRWGNGEFGVDGATKAKAVIKELTEQAGVDMQNVNKETAVKFREDFDAELKQIKSGVTDSIVTALFEGGKAGSKKLRDVLVSVLRQKVTMVVDVGVNAFMNSLIGGAQSGGNSILGMAGNASSLYSAVSGNGIIGNAVSTVGGWLGFGGAVGSSLATGLATTTTTSGIATGLGLKAGASGLGLQAGGQTLGGTLGSTVGGGAAAGGGVMGALKAIPGWGWALAGVALLGTMLSKKQTLHSGAGAIYNSDTGVQEGAGIYNMGTFGMGDVREYNKDGQALASGIAAGLGSTLDGIAKAFGQKAGYEVATAFADDTSTDGAWGALRISQGGKDLLNWQDTRTSKWAPKEFADGAEGQAQYLAAIANDTRKVLLDMDLPGWADTMLNRLGELANMDQLSAAVAQIAQAQTAFEAFGQYMPVFAGLADTAISKLVDASGGVGALAGNMSAFVDGFYTDAEKLAVNTQNVTDALAKLGFEMPQTREEFKTLVASQLAIAGLQLGSSGEMIQVSQAMNEAAAKSAADLLALSGAVSAVLPPFEDAAAGVGAAIDTLSSSVIDEINRLRGYTDTSGNSPQALVTEFDRLTTLARGGDANAFNSLGDTSKLLDDYYKNTATSAVQYAYQRSVLANSLEQSYNTAKASGATFSGTSSLMGTPALSAPVVSSVSSANAAGSSGLADLLGAVVTELTMLRAEVRADVVHNAKTAKILERVTPEGDALATRNEG